MDFTEAVIFLAATIAIIAAGVVLGVALQRRSRPDNWMVQNVYFPLLTTMDNLRESPDYQKKKFIAAYYLALLNAPDSIIERLNEYLVLVSQSNHEINQQAVSEARDKVALIMRKQSLKTRLKHRHMMSVQVDKD